MAGDMFDALMTPYRLARNAVDFPVRRKVRVRRPVRDVQPGGLDATLDWLPEAEQRRARRLIADYGLDAFARRARRRDILENLWYLDMLIAALDVLDAQLPRGEIEAADIGVSHWFYAPALHGLLKHWRARPPRKVELAGYEIDPWRLYGDGHTRADWAEWFTRGLDGVLFATHDAFDVRTDAHVITMLYPFLFARDLDRWGLPRSQHRPRELLAHAWAHLRVGGYLIVANQGDAEAAAQQKLFREVGVRAHSFPFESAFMRYPESRHVHVAAKLRA